MPDQLLQYSYDPEENLRQRVELLEDCERDKTLQKYVKELCRRDILFWVNMFCWTKDPRREPDTIPFVCYDTYQEKYMKDIEKSIDDQEDHGTDKSRDMGVSWMVLYVFMHKWLFERGSDFRVGSRKEDFVDKIGVIDTLLEKVRFNLRLMPKWLLPKGFSVEQHATHMRIINPEIGNTIVGESANEDFGSGGRSKAILLDEFSKWDNRCADAAWTATADVTGCRLPVSTPKGSGNKFARLLHGSDEKIKKTSLHWTLHPRKAADAYYIAANSERIPVEPKKAFLLWNKGYKIRSPWYDEEDARRTPADLAQEVDINYLMSGYPFFDLQALNTQVLWEEDNYTNVIKSGLSSAAGKYFRANIVEVDHKMILRPQVDGWLKVYETPRSAMQYAIGADTSEGLPKGDESAGVVRDKWTRDVVAVIHGLYAPEDFAIKLWRIAKYYNDADIAPENNNHGYTVCRDLEELGCKLYYMVQEESAGGKVQQTAKRGWSTNARTRPMMLDQMAEEIRLNAFQMRDKELSEQCKLFVKNEKSGKPEADGSFLDDLVLANSICGMLIQYKPYKPAKNKTIKADMGKRLKRKNAGFSFASS